MSSLLRSMMVVPHSIRCICSPGVLDQSKSAIFSRVRFCSNKPAVAPQPEKTVAHETLVRQDISRNHNTTPFQKRVLVHFEYYPNLETVPARVPSAMMTKALSQARIKVSISMMIVGLILCFLTAWYGKAHRYETSLAEVNIRRHEAYKIGETGRGGRMALIFPDQPVSETKEEQEE